MGMEATLYTLEVCLHNLRETMASLYTTVVEDRPLGPADAPQDTPALVDILGNSAEDLTGWAIEALGNIRESQAALHRGDLDGLRRTMATCHQRTTHITQRLFVDLLPYERVADIVRVGRTRGGEWRAWALSVKHALDACRQPMFDLQQAEYECWQEIAERSGRQSISIQATSVGKQVVETSSY